MTVVTTLFGPASQMARAAELIPPGIAPKVSAGAGETVSRGPSALFYNPANLIFAKFFEPYLDVSLAKITYTYQHTRDDKYDPVVVDVTVPPVTGGIALRPIPMLAFGVAFMPTSSGAEQNIPNVPIFQGKDLGYGRMNVAKKDSGMKIAAGAAVRFAFPFSVGAGLVRTSQRTQLFLTPVDEEGVEADEALVDALYGGAANQYVVGIRSEIVDRGLVVAASYRTAATLAYLGDVLVNTSPEADYEPYEGVDYLPAAVGVGAEARFGPVGAFVDFVHEFWAPGRTLANRGVGDEYDEVDYLDVNNICVGAKAWVAKKHMLAAAFGLYGSNLGDGTEVGTTEPDEVTLADGADAEPSIAGMQFGSLDAIARQVVSGGYRYKLSGMGYFELAAHMQSGTRVVPEGFAQEGSYSLRVLMGSAGIALGF